MAGISWWTPARDDLLRAAIADGCDYREAAARLTASEGRVVTRAAANSRGQQLGLHPPRGRRALPPRIPCPTCGKPLPRRKAADAPAAAAPVSAETT